jgi:chromosomal replication initiation ATPase DnaA
MPIPKKLVNRRALAQRIVAEVAQKHGLTITSVMRDPGRKPEVIAARRIAMRRIYKELSFPLTRIATFFGKDVNTVHYHVRRVP